MLCFIHFHQNRGTGGMMAANRQLKWKWKSLTCRLKYVSFPDRKIILVGCTFATDELNEAEKWQRKYKRLFEYIAKLMQIPTINHSWHYSLSIQEPSIFTPFGIQILLHLITQAHRHARVIILSIMSSMSLACPLWHVLSGMFSLACPLYHVLGLPDWIFRFPLGFLTCM